MSRPTVIALRIVLVMTLAGSLFVQAVMLPLVWVDLDGAPSWLRVSLVALAFLGIVTVQVVAVCVWRLLTLVRRGTVFSDASFRYVDIVFVAVLVASTLTFTTGVVLAPGEAVAPGVVLLIGGLGVLIAGVALVVRVLRALLAQAVARDVEASRMRAELDEVV